MDAVIVIYNLNDPEFHIRFIFLLTNKLVYGHVNVFLSEYEWIFETKIGDIEFCLNQCCRCYEEGLRAVESTTEDNKLEMRSSLKKRLANIKNELGVWYMNKAQACLQNDGKMCVIIKKKTDRFFYCQRLR